MEDYCIKCGKKLDFDDIGLTRKMINRGAAEFLCISCIGEHFKIEESLLRDKIEYFRRMGCTLFPASKPEK